MSNEQNQTEKAIAQCLYSSARHYWAKNFEEAIGELQYVYERIESMESEQKQHFITEVIQNILQCTTTQVTSIFRNISRDEADVQLLAVFQLSTMAQMEKKLTEEKIIIKEEPLN